MNEASAARRGLDLLLAAYPRHDLISLDWQIDPSDERQVSRWGGPWLLVELGTPGAIPEIEPIWVSARYAIWRRTGAVYRIGLNGAVEDDPFLEVEP